MIKKILFRVILLFVFIQLIIFAQEKKSESSQWIKLDDDLQYNIATAVDRDQNITKGLLYGIKGDSIYLAIKNKIIPLDLRQLLSITIEDNRKSNFFTITGAISFMYLGSILFLTSKDQPAYYIQYDEFYAPALYELLFATIGGGIGYLIDSNSKETQRTFYFSSDDEIYKKEIKKLEDFLSNSGDKGKLNLNVSLSQVNTRYTETKDKLNNYYYYDEIHSFNLLRRLSLTYNIYEKFDIGVAVEWFGEPNINHYYYDYSYGNYISYFVNQKFDAKGYFGIINYHPFGNDDFDLTFGAGLGVGDINYNLSESKSYFNGIEEIAEIKESIIDKNIFTMLFNAELRLYLFPRFNVSIQADYIYLNEKMPPITSLNIGERSLGNFGFGVGFGIKI